MSKSETSFWMVSGFVFALIGAMGAPNIPLILVGGGISACSLVAMVINCIEKRK